MLWSVQRTIWPPRIRVVAEVSSAPAGKRRRGILHPECLTLCQLCLFITNVQFLKASTPSLWNIAVFWVCFFLNSHGRHVPVMFASAETAHRNKSTERGDECNFGEPPSRVDELICVVPGGPTLRFPRITGRNEQRSVTAHISYAAGGPHITSPLRKKATRNVSRTPECPLVRYHHPRAEVM